MFRLLLVSLTALVLTALVAVAPAEKADVDKPVLLFNGKDFAGWKLKGKEEKSKWVVGFAAMDEQAATKLIVDKTGAGEAQLVNAERGVDIFTEHKFGDGTVEVEFMVPKGSNSGIYVMGEYEVQILDSFGVDKVGPGDLGGLYGAAAPRVNASKKPGDWQKLVIEYQAPKFEGDTKVANMKFIKVVLNDHVIHENVEMKGPTAAALTGKEAATGPVMIQGDHGPVALRGIKFTPKVK